MSFIRLASKEIDISEEAFRIQINEIRLGLPQSLGKVFFFDWWCDSIRSRSDCPVTPESMDEWLQGKNIPPPEQRRLILNCAFDAVQSAGIAESDFLKFIHHCKEYLDACF